MKLNNKMNKLINLIIFILIIVSVKCNVKATEVPTITGVNVNQNFLYSDLSQNADIKIATKGNEQIQFRIFFYEVNTKKLTEITNGYSNIVQGTGTINYNLNKQLPRGTYRISVWIKRVGKKGIKSNLNGEFDSSYCINDFQILGRPTITNIKSTIYSSDSQSIYLTTNWLNSVKYRVFFYDKDLKKLMEITSGYTASVKGNTPFKVDISPLHYGNYRITIWAKDASKINGIQNNSNGDFDSALCVDQTIVKDLDIDKQVPVINDVTINKGQKANLTDASLSISSQGFPKVQYRVFFYNIDTKKLKELTNGYEGSFVDVNNYKYEISQPIEAGTYRISVWVRKYGSNKGQYENINGDFDNSYCIQNVSVNPEIVANDIKQVLYFNESKTFNVYTDGIDKVQYRLFAYNMDTKSLKEITEGYTDAVDGQTPYKFSLDGLEPGKYRISIWGRREGKIGLKSNVNGDFDVSKTSEITLYEKQLISNVIVPGKGIVAGGSFKINSSGEGYLQYRIFITNNLNSEKYELTQGYTAPILAGTPYDFKLQSQIPTGKYNLTVYTKAKDFEGEFFNEDTKYDDVYSIENVNFLPDLQVINYTSSILLGSKLSLSVKTPGYNNVRYRVFSYDLFLNKLVELTNGYTDSVDGNNILNLAFDNSFGTGSYRISVWEKEADNLGLNTNANGDYDNSYTFQLNCNRDSKNEEKVTSNYVLSISDFIEKQFKVGAVYDNSGIWTPATKDMIGYYANSNNFTNNEYTKYQFLKLSYFDSVTVEEINNLLKGKGVLENQGQNFIDASKLYNINPIYLVSHALLETGNGRSQLAVGIVVNGVKVYNLFGIHAFDYDPNACGSQYAASEGWNTIKKAIYGGAEFISSLYINNSYYKQDTLYKMRWNPDKPGIHQYATDIRWAYNQIYNIKRLLDQCPNAKLILDIPNFK